MKRLWRFSLPESFIEGSRWNREKMGTGPILYERGHSQLEGITAENGACPHFFLSPFFLDKINLGKIDITRTSDSKWNGWRAELRRRREERRGNGVKNLKGAKPFLCILPVKLATQNGREPIYQTHLIIKWKYWQAAKSGWIQHRQ